MGSGASSCVSEAVDTSTEQELQASLQGLTFGDRTRLLATLGSPTALPVENGTSIENSKFQSASTPVSAADFSLESLKGTWRATRISEWGPSKFSDAYKNSYYVWHFDDKGNYKLHHNPVAYGQLRYTQAKGIFEGEGMNNGGANSVVFTLDQDGRSAAWQFKIGSIAMTYLFEKVPVEDWDSTAEGAFHLAVELGDLEAVKRVLADPKAEAFLLAPDLAGSTAMHKCAYFDQAMVMRTILENATEHEALLRAVNSFGSTALHAAAQAGSKEMCSLILQYAKEPSALLTQVNHGGNTPFAWAQDMATSHFLCTYRKSVSFQWPNADSITADEDHLTMGMTAQCVDEAMDALKAETYVRNEDELSWVTDTCGDIFTGYDNCALVKISFLRSEGYSPYSMLEVMASSNHPGVGRADCFLSHAQREPVSLTLDCMRQYELRRGQPIKFFVDIYALRQCVHDFELPLVKQAIQTIGLTVMIVEPWKSPYTLSRVFCTFEVFVTVDAELAFEAVTPRSEIPGMLADMSSGANSLDSVVCEVQRAESRRPKDKAKIDKFIMDGPGFDRTNSLTGTAVKTALLIQAHQMETEGRLSVDMIGQALLDLGPQKAAKIAATRGVQGQTFVHRLCKSASWLQKLELIFGGATQSLLLAEDAAGRSPLMRLVQAEDNFVSIQHLLQAAEDADALILQPVGKAGDTPGFLPMVVAAYLGKPDTCQALLSKASNCQAVLQATCPFGYLEGGTALGTAAQCSHLAVCELLLDSADDPGALAMQIGSKGNTPLHSAAISGNSEVAKLILAKAPDPQALLLQGQNETGTALHIAADKGHMEFARYLLETAADQMSVLRATDSSGRTPEMVAESGGRQDVVQLLQSAGSEGGISAYTFAQISIAKLHELCSSSNPTT